MDNKELRLEILRIVVESGSENQKSNPLPICEEYYTWICKSNENLAYKNKIGRYSIPMLFYTADKSLIGVDSVVTQHIDIMPTVLDFLGYNKPFISFGESVFRKKGWAIHHNNNRYCLITQHGKIDQNLKNSFAELKKVLMNFAHHQLKRGIQNNIELLEKTLLI